MGLAPDSKMSIKFYLLTYLLSYFNRKARMQCQIHPYIYIYVILYYIILYYIILYYIILYYIIGMYLTLHPSFPILIRKLGCNVRYIPIMHVSANMCCSLTICLLCSPQLLWGTARNGMRVWIHGKLDLMGAYACTCMCVCDTHYVQWCFLYERIHVARAFYNAIMMKLLMSRMQNTCLPSMLSQAVSLCVLLIILLL